MRIWIVVVAVLAACGPSGKQVAGAKTAHYRGDQLVLFAAANSATEARYKHASSDETTLRVVTEGRWYSPEGLGLTATMDNLGNVPDRSIFLALTLQLMTAGDALVVAVSPTILRYHQGRPNPDRLASDDPSLPGWVGGKLDQLQLAVHEALRPYEVQTAGATEAR